MANQSAKKNEQAIKGRIKFVNYVLYPLFAFFLILNMFFAIDGSISLWHLLLCVAVAVLSHFCIRQTIKCWELQLPPEASEYYIDLLALNSLVALLDPITHKIWNVYWLIVVLILYKVGGFLWDYITPKYEEEEKPMSKTQEKKQKREKKEKIKYVKN